MSEHHFCILFSITFYIIIAHKYTFYTALLIPANDSTALSSKSQLSSYFFLDLSQVAQ